MTHLRAFCLFFGLLLAHGCENTPLPGIPVVLTRSIRPDFQVIVEAIRRSENSKKYPYGIRSVKCKTTEKCRKIAENTVKNNYERWLKAGRPGRDFINFLANKYAPAEASNDPRRLNQFWYRNVTFHMKQIANNNAQEKAI